MTPIAPFKIADNLYYVGSRDLASYLIVTPQGDILIQVIAKNYQTFGETFAVDEEQKTIEIKLKQPQSQYTAH